MEIQLVGPKGTNQSSRFTKFFDDDIVIEPNSKIFLNHAIISKNEGVNFTEEQTVNFSIDQANVYGNLQAAPLLTFTVPEGFMTYNTLRNLLQQNLQAMLDDATNGNTFKSLKAMNSITNNGTAQIWGLKFNRGLGEITATTFGNSAISIGSILTNNIISQNVASANDCQSYYLYPTAYGFVNYANTQDIVLTESNEVPAIPTVVVALTKGAGALTTDEMINEGGGFNPKCMFGFYGKQYAENATVGVGTRTNSTGIENIDGRPNSFITFSVERELVDGVLDVYLKIYLANSTVGGNIKSWETQKNETNSMVLVKTINLSSGELFLGGESLEFLYGAYIARDDQDYISTPDVYPIVWARTGRGTVKLWDGKVQNYYFPYDFFKGLTFTPSGTGYTPAGQVGRTTTVAPLGGSGCIVSYTANAGGEVQGITITTNGSNYTDGDVLTIVAGNSDATFTVDVDSEGILTVRKTDIFKESQLALYPFIANNINTYGNLMYNQTNYPDATTVAIKSYKVSGTTDIAKVMGLGSDKLSNKIFPPGGLVNHVGAPSLLYPNSGINIGFEDIYKLQSYVIKINNLPIMGYKTNETIGNRGYKQNILSTIPTPFSSANEQTTITISSEDYISSTYSTLYPMVKEMRNQKMVVNHFDVEVTHLTDDTNAEDLDQVSVNFTIMSGN